QDQFGQGRQRARRRHRHRQTLERIAPMADLRSAAGLALGLAALLAAPSAQAHRMWMTPSATVLSGEEAWVTVDAAVSNTLFHPDHVPMRLDSVTVVAPDGSIQAPENPSTGKYRSVFD